MSDDLSIVEFENRAALRAWLEDNAAVSAGVWVRLAKRHADFATVTFHELLEEGLCFGWSESTRRRGGAESYLQRFTPRRAKGTTSQRNLDLAALLIEDGAMTPQGIAALGLDRDT